MHGDTDGASLIGDGASDSLSDPPGGVGAEFEAFTVVVLFHGAHQPGIAFLDEVEKFQTAIVITFGDADHQAHVCLDHLVLGFFFVTFGAVDFAQEEDQFGAGHLCFQFHTADLTAGVFDLTQSFHKDIGVHIGFVFHFIKIFIAFLGAAAVGADFVYGIAFDPGEVIDGIVAFFNALYQAADAVNHAFYQFIVVRQTHKGFHHLSAQFIDLFLSAGGAGFVKIAIIQNAADFIQRILVFFEDFLESINDFDVLIFVYPGANIHLEDLIQPHTAFTIAVQKVVHFAQSGACLEHILIDHLLVGFYLFGYSYLAIPVQKRNSAHFAQIHTYRVIIKAFGLELFGCCGFSNGRSAFGDAFLGFVDDFDPVLGKVENDVVHLIQKERTAGQDVVDLFEGDISGFFSQIHQLFQTFVISNHQCSLAMSSLYERTLFTTRFVILRYSRESVSFCLRSSRSPES